MTKEEAIARLKVLTDYEYNEDLEALDMAIKTLEQKLKTGYWILDETDNSITCNKCGCLMWAGDLYHGNAHYCPNCGTEMKGEK